MKRLSLTLRKASLFLLASLILAAMASCSKHDDATPELIVNVKTPAGYLDEPDVTGYVILSGEDGKALSYKKMVNGETIQIKPDAAYTGKTFMLTEYYVLSYTNKVVNATTVTDIPFGSFNWTASFGGNEATSGEFIFGNDNSGDQYNYGSNIDYSSIEDFSPYSNTVFIGGKSTKLFVSRSKYSEAKTYHFFDNAGAGFAPDNDTPYNIDLSLVTSAYQSKKFTYQSDASNVSLHIYGELKTGNFAGQYSLRSDQGYEGEINSGVPTEGFDDYVYETFQEFDKGRFTNTTLSVPDFTPLNVEYTATELTSKSIKLTTTGIYDFAFVSFGVIDDSNWIFIVPSSTTERNIVIPEIPAGVTSEAGSVNLSSLVYSGLTVVDIKSITSYNEFLAFVSSHDISTTYEDKEAHFEPTLNSGRVAKSEIKRLFRH